MAWVFFLVIGTSPKPPSDEGGGTVKPCRRERKLPLSHAVRVTAPLTRGALWARRRNGDRKIMKATGIVRRVDDLGRIVIPKEIRRTLKIREGDPSLTTLTPIDRFCVAIHSVVRQYKK